MTHNTTTFMIRIIHFHFQATFEIVFCFFMEYVSLKVP